MKTETYNIVFTNKKVRSFKPMFTIRNGMVIGGTNQFFFEKTENELIKYYGSFCSYEKVADLPKRKVKSVYNLYRKNKLK